VGNAVKYHFALRVAGNAGEEGLILFIFNFDIFYSGSGVSLEHSKSPGAT
jgi:hypothetical protein